MLAAIAVLAVLALPPLGHAQGGFLGAKLDAMDAQSSAQLGLDPGAVVVMEVVPGGPAETSGLRAGDVITSFDGRPVQTPVQVVNAVRMHHPGDRAKVGIVHPMGQRTFALEIMVQIGSAPASTQAWNAGEAQAGGQGYYAGNAGAAHPQQQRPQGSYAASPGRAPITPDQAVQPVRQGQCSAMLPSGWELQPGPNGQSADIAGPNGAHAAWGISAVNPAMRRFYGDMYGPPDAHVTFLLSGMLKARPQLTSTHSIANFYTIHEFEAGDSAGVVLYHVYPAPMGQYIISEYYAWAPRRDAALLSRTEAIMTSLQCQSQVRPSERVLVTPHSGVPDRKQSGSAESDSLKDYNSILGTQYAHDDTGRLYLLDRASQWGSGPDGDGYYVGTGVNRKKLTPGME